jgi:hypothetical protein
MKIATGDMEHKGSQTQDVKIKRRNFVVKVVNVMETETWSPITPYTVREYSI